MLGMMACGSPSPARTGSPAAEVAASAERPYLLERVEEAAMAGRDIYCDQRYAHNLEMRDVLESIVTHPAGIDPKTLEEIRRDEVVARVDHLNPPSYTGFVMPKLEAARTAGGEITDVTISYPLDVTAQMLEYAAATRSAR